MIRAVIDTNIIVSAFFWGGLPRAALNAARTKRCRMITTENLIDELKDVISRPRFVKRLAQIGETVDSLLENDYRALVEVVEPAQIEPVILDDPDDDALIACALGGAADYIISGDHHLLDLGEYQSIKIWTVNRFLEAVVTS
ncbi:MAG: putative toxin-antitoxin system toxin component, PIN family [Caldilineaceae bacterium]|nr:putative toxin-antitoxin system toxin component, PIN family [Caldilineaceae bacterium]